MLEDTLGSFIKRRREKAGMTRDHLLALIRKAGRKPHAKDFTYGQLVELETGKLEGRPPYSTLMTLGMILEFHPDAVGHLPTQVSQGGGWQLFSEAENLTILIPTRSGSHGDLLKGDLLKLVEDSKSADLKITRIFQLAYGPFVYCLLTGGDTAKAYTFSRNDGQFVTKVPGVPLFVEVMKEAIKAGKQDL